MKKFEHEVDIITSFNLDDIVGVRGDNGWELVTVIQRENKGYPISYYYWKREITEGKQIL
jgi:hypothetical protein